jgi:hypothetical protein
MKGIKQKHRKRNPLCLLMTDVRDEIKKMTSQRIMWRRILLEFVFQILFDVADKVNGMKMERVTP